MRFKKKIFSNGMRLIMVPMPHSLTTTVLVLTETGSKYETKNINGVSHFLEHLCFKGTEKRASAKAVSQELDGLGASYNAFTGHEYTGYYAKAEARHFKNVLDVLSDIYLNATLPAEEIEKERGVIVGEIQMYEDNPQRDIWDLFTELLYGDQPAGWPIAGTREIIKRVSREEIVEYRRAHYVASSTIVVVAGKYDEAEVVRQTEAMFKHIARRSKTSKKKTEDSQRKPAVLIKHKKTSQTHIIFGFRGYGVTHKDITAAQVLAAVLGGGMSSRLFHRIRDELGAGYYVGAEHEPLTDHGLFSIFTGVHNARVAEILDAIADEVLRIMKYEVGDAELKKVKNYLVGNLFSGLETSNAQAQFYGMDEVLKKRPKTPQEYADEIRSVSKQDILRVARDLFKKKNLNIALVGPFKASDKKKLTDSCLSQFSR